MWKNNRRRFAEKFDTWDIIRKYNQGLQTDLRGDATMSPYEILQPGGSVEYMNEEPGAESVAAPDRTPLPSTPGSTPSRKACGSTARASTSSTS